MFDLGWAELLVIGIVALIVVGPKDLPGMFRALGRFTGKIRRMAREFQRAMDDAADQAGVKDVAGDLKNMTNPSRMGMDKIKEAAKSFEDYDPSKPSKSSETKESTLSEERADAAKKIHEYSAKKTQERLDRENAEAAAETPAPEQAADAGESKESKA